MTYEFNDIIVPVGSSVVSVLESRVRAKRNDLLSKTDWWAVQDRTMSQLEKDYRQALRDITTQPGFPLDVTWPTKPE